MEQLPKEIEFELTLPVTVRRSGKYWDIIDKTGNLFMGRKEKNSIRAIALFLNNYSELVRRCNAFEELLAACESADLGLNMCAKYLLGTGPIPEPEAIALTIIEIKEALKVTK